MPATCIALTACTDETGQRKGLELAGVHAVLIHLQATGTARKEPCRPLQRDPEPVSCDQRTPLRACPTLSCTAPCSCHLVVLVGSFWEAICGWHASNTQAKTAGRQIVGSGFCGWPEAKASAVVPESNFLRAMLQNELRFSRDEESRHAQVSFLRRARSLAAMRRLVAEHLPEVVTCNATDV